MSSGGYSSTNLGCVVFCFSLLSGCVINTYQIEKQEALRAVGEVQSKPETVVRARNQDQGREVAIRLFSDDELEILAGEAEPLEMELRHLLREPEKLEHVQELRFKERSWAPFFFYTGIAATVVSYLASTVIALNEKNGGYAIPVYGPARWSLDVTNDCDGMVCVLAVPAALMFGFTMATAHVAGPLHIVFSAPKLKGSREVPLEQAGLGGWNSKIVGLSLQANF